MTNNKKSLLTFPCAFSIKAFGLDTQAFRDEVIQIIRIEFPEFKENTITTNISKNGKYISLNIPLQVDSQSQLDNIYRALSSSPLVIMAL